MTADPQLGDRKIGGYPLRSSRKVWQGRVFGLREDIVELPGGGPPVTRQYLDHPGAVAIAAVRTRRARKKPEILLLEQYRHPVRAKLWELPAGLLDQPQEAPLAAAKRELWEEADLVAESWEVLVDLFTSPGASDESLRVYLARGLTRSEEPFPRQEEEADMQVRWVDLDDAVHAVLGGALHNPTAVVGILAAAQVASRRWKGTRQPTAHWLR